jgi:hypothetical protein
MEYFPSEIEKTIRNYTLFVCSSKNLKWKTVLPYNDMGWSGETDTRDARQAVCETRLTN